MLHSILAVEVASWQLWSLPIVTLVSVGVGMAFGRFLAIRPAAAAPAPVPAPAPNPPSPTATTPASVHHEHYWAEKRSSPRLAVRSTHVLVSEAPGRFSAFEGVVLNRSLGGLGLSVDRQFRSGQVLHVSLGDDAEPENWVAVEVRYCRPERGRWTLGCKFVDAAPVGSC